MTTKAKSTSTSLEQVLIDLLASFMSTNGVGVQVGFPVSLELVKSKVFSFNDLPGDIIALDEDKIFDEIMAKGYPRGAYVVRLIAGRISKSIEQINSQGGSVFLGQLNSSGYSGVRSRLLPLYGVGEKFIEAYCLLAGIQKS
jgi:hypothetical protein